jgi:hypothetical protein
MTDPRARRVAVLTAAAQAKSTAKTAAAEQAIRRLIKRGEPITFQAVQREAGVSHAFLYNHPDLRGRIEHLRARGRPPSSNPTPATTTTATTATATPESTLVLALTAQINQLKQQHRTQVHALHAALERAHGENLDLRRELARRRRPADHTSRATDDHV